MEIREILSQYEYNGDEAIIIRGSALNACNDADPETGENKVLELIAAMDANIPIPERNKDKPFLLSIESTFTIPGRGTVATGTVE